MSVSSSSLSLPILSFTEKAKSLSQIQQAHAFMLKTGLFHDTFSASKLITFAVENPEPKTVSYAHSILNRIENPNAFTHNAVIRAYANSSTPETALMAFQEMLLGDSVWPDKYSFTFVLKACGVFCGVEEGKQIHGLWLKSGLDSDVFVENTLVNVYGRSGCFEVARKVLDGMSVRDVVSWNSLLSAFVEKGLVEEARELFDEMEERNVESWNFMVSGYAGVGLIREAKEVFDCMEVRDVVSWNAMLSGYADGGCYDEVLELFNEMLRSEEEPDGFTFVNVLSACANLGSLSQGEWVHVYIDKNGIVIEGFLATALVDMYSKCGKIDKALEVFRGVSKKDVSTWNSMISGLSVHGLGNDALEIFYEMVHEGFKPNSITFIAILSACNHVGLLDQARKLFENMNSVYGIEPTIEHYGCMVDLLGRMGKIEEAEELVNKVPADEASILLESLLGACNRFGRKEEAESIANRLLELNPQGSSGYVQISNLYASNGRWDEVKEVRKKMRAEKVNKKPGCSMIEVDGVVHEFLAGEGLIND